MNVAAERGIIVLRAALGRSWRQEQDGETFIVMRLADWDAMRTAVNDVIEAKYGEEGS